MKVAELAAKVIEACEAENVEDMLTGAFATSFYGVPRSTKDVDLVLSVTSAEEIQAVMARLDATVEFDSRMQFDTLTWGRRHVGTMRKAPFYRVELFERFDDPFVQEQFARRVKLVIGPLGREAHIPMAEDVNVQKLRWARDKDLIDAEDVLVVQEPSKLDIDYIQRWCLKHGSETRFQEMLAKLPEY